MGRGGRFSLTLDFFHSFSTTPGFVGVSTAASPARTFFRGPVLHSAFVTAIVLLTTAVDEERGVGLPSVGSAKAGAKK